MSDRSNREGQIASEKAPTIGRRDFMRLGALGAAGVAAGRLGLPAGAAPAGAAGGGKRPNVIVLLTDDQGYADFSCHGNPVLKTPNMDRLHDQSVRFTDFHVAPMCTPTRSQLMTGQDCLHNGASSVCAGRSMIDRQRRAHLAPQFLQACHQLRMDRRAGAATTRALAGEFGAAEILAQISHDGLIKERCTGSHNGQTNFGYPRLSP